MFHGHPLQNVLAWISLLGYLCGYPHLYGELKIDIQKSWIFISITVGFRKCMYADVLWILGPRKVLPRNHNQTGQIKSRYTKTLH